MNLAQVKAVLETPAPVSKKELQHFIDRLVALGRFIAQFIDKLHPIFNTFWEANMSGWTDECEHTFEAIKRYLIEPPILSSLEAEEELYIYLVVSDFAINVVLFWHNQSNEQRHVYYVSKAMVDVETRYSQVEQMTLALWVVAKKLRSYFQAY